MSQAASFTIIGIFCLAVLIYIIYIYETYQNKTGLFKPYVPSPPSNSCNPLGGVRKLTPQEIEKRKQILSNAPPKGTPIVCGTTQSSEIIATTSPGYMYLN